MKINWIQHVGVAANGLIAAGGAVRVDGNVSINKNCGCGSVICDCNMGHSFCKVYPRTPDGVVEIVTIIFEGSREMLPYSNYTPEQFEAMAMPFHPNAVKAA